MMKLENYHPARAWKRVLRRGCVLNGSVDEDEQQHDANGEHADD